MTDRMSPDDVPDQLIVAARDAWNAAPQKRDGKPTRMRHALAAVWPEIEQQVRERIAAEIEAVVVIARRDTGPAEAKAQAYQHAARIARGETR
jgi:hypothetical protein